jgi:formate hydrogenlyase subunit 6/NADH:ubiquinone oxidoreductase subunit I
MGLGTAVSRLAAMVLVTQPKVRRKKCVKCGSCAEACPVEAIAMTDSGPLIDYRRCIACFCCHEMCRYEAMTLSRRMRFLQSRLP